MKHRMVGSGTGYRGSGAAGSDGSIILPRMGPAITSQSHPNESGTGENTPAVGHRAGARPRFWHLCSVLLTAA